MAFTPINTQEEFDAAIGERLSRDRESQAKKYEGWTSPEDLKKITDAHEAEIKKLTDAAAESEAKIKDLNEEIAKGNTYRADLEKTRIAIAHGLDIKYADRLRGKTREEWEADAKDLANDFAAYASAQNQPAPLGSPGTSGTKTTRDQFADTVNQFFS